MRILVLTNMYPPHAYGGYEYLCRDAAERWQAQGHDVVVLTSTVRVAGAEEVSPGVVPVWRSLQLYWDDHVILRPPPWRRLRWELGNKRVLDRVIDEFRPDVVSAWAMGATSLGLLSRAHRRGLPVVLVLADEWPVYGPALDGWLRMFARRRLAGRVAQALTGLPTLPPRLDTIGPACFASDALRTAVRARSPWSFPNSTVVHLGIETREFAAAGQRGLDAGSETASASGGSPPVERPWQWKLLYVGRIDRRKGIDVAVRALALCPPAATLSIVGRGDDEVREELAQLATELGLADRVTFDHVPRDELAAVYRAADAFIFPPTWEEPFGLVPLEAMACGTPVIASPTGGSAEFLADGENCVSFPVGDHEALASALARIAQDRPLRRRIVESGLATAAAFDVDVMAERLEAWHRIATDPGAPPPAEMAPHAAGRASPPVAGRA